MCAVSMITDHYRDKWPVMPLTPYQLPQTFLVPTFQITLAQWEEYQKLKRDAEAYDRRTKQPDCVKPEVAEWEKAMHAYLVKQGILKSE